MTFLVPTAVLLSLIAVLAFVYSARKARRNLKCNGSPAAIRWAARHYPEEPARTTASRFVTILEDMVNIPVVRFTPATRFLEDLGMDEAEPVKLAMAVEEELGVRPTEEEYAACLTVDDIVRMLVLKMSESGQIKET